MIDSDQVITEYFSNSVEETQEIGQTIAKTLVPGQTVAFLGGLGAGKTSLIKGLASALNKTPKNTICSPTFTYLNIYPGSVDIFHFDLYRIKNANQFLNMGFDEYFDKNGICLIEWSEKITTILPANTIAVHLLEKDDASQRKITVLKL